MTASPMTETNKPTWEGFNGWANRETWNASLWINNDEDLYEIALGCTSYQQFIDTVISKTLSFKTGDGVRWDDPKIDHDEMNEMLDEMHD